MLSNSRREDYELIYQFFLLGEPAYEFLNDLKNSPLPPYFFSLRKLTVKQSVRRTVYFSNGHAGQCPHGDVSVMNLSTATPKHFCYCFICPLDLKYSLLLQYLNNVVNGRVLDLTTSKRLDYCFGRCAQSLNPFAALQQPTCLSPHAFPMTS